MNCLNNVKLFMMKNKLVTALVLSLAVVLLLHSLKLINVNNLFVRSPETFANVDLNGSLPFNKDTVSNIGNDKNVEITVQQTNQSAEKGPKVMGQSNEFSNELSNEFVTNHSNDNEVFYNYRYDDTFSKKDFIEGRGLVTPNEVPFLYDREHIVKYPHANDHTSYQMSCKTKQGSREKLGYLTESASENSGVTTSEIKPYELTEIHCNRNFDASIEPINMKHDTEAQEAGVNTNVNTNALDMIGRFMREEQPDPMCKMPYTGYDDILRKKVSQGDYARISMKRTQDRGGGGYYGTWCIDSQETDIPWSYNQNEFGSLEEQVNKVIKALG